MHKITNLLNDLLSLVILGVVVFIKFFLHSFYKGAGYLRTLFPVKFAYERYFIDNADINL